MGISVLLVSAIVLLIIGSVIWISGGREKNRREQNAGKTFAALGLLALIGVCAFIYVLARIL